MARIKWLALVLIGIGNISSQAGPITIGELNYYKTYESLPCNCSLKIANLLAKVAFTSRIRKRITKKYHLSHKIPVVIC